MANKTKILSTISLVLVLALLLGELIARYTLGLGTPPLSISHDEIEYMFKPNQDVDRFGNRVLINEYGMRAQEVPVSSQSILRVMVFGDSVINGGSLTDHSNLATTLLQNKLNSKSSNTGWVGNASAGSWGVSNIYAYVNEYGLFKSDYVFFVFNSDDISDCPTFAPLNKNTHPTKQPVSALIEGATRYLPRYLPMPDNTQPPTQTAEKNDRICIQQSTTDLNSLLQVASKSAKKVAVFHHPSVEELETGKYDKGYLLLKDVATKNSVDFIEMQNYFINSEGGSKYYYRDPIHINDQGQKKYFEAFSHIVASEP
jgi:hypothetical protein